MSKAILSDWYSAWVDGGALVLGLDRERWCGLLHAALQSQRYNPDRISSSNSSDISYSWGTIDTYHNSITVTSMRHMASHITGLCAGNKRPILRKSIPFDDVITVQGIRCWLLVLWSRCRLPYHMFFYLFCKKKYRFLSDSCDYGLGFYSQLNVMGCTSNINIITPGMSDNPVEDCTTISKAKQGLKILLNSIDCLEECLGSCGRRWF